MAPPGAQSVSLERFKTERRLELVPPDGEFAVIDHRSAQVQADLKDLTLSARNPDPAAQPGAQSVLLERFETERRLELVPPDGDFAVMHTCSD